MVGNHIFMTEEQVLLSRAMRRLFPWKTCKNVSRPQVSSNFLELQLSTKHICGQSFNISLSNLSVLRTSARLASSTW